MKFKVDISYKSLNKRNEELCGDHIELLKTENLPFWFWRMVWAAGKGQHSVHPHCQNFRHHALQWLVAG